MRSKKGSHVGMVLSFVIFVAFLAFLYSAMSPAINIEPSKNSLLEYLKNEMINQASDTLISITITYPGTPTGEDCWLINNSDFLDSNEFDYETMGIIAKDKDNKILSVGEPNLLGAEITKIKWSGEDFLKIYYSNENFTSPTINSCADGNSNYDLGLVISRQRIFESKIIEMVNKHETNYIGLKQDLSLPFDSDFSFAFVADNGTEIRTGSQDVSFNVYSGEYPIQYIDSEANTKFGTLKLSVW